MQAGTPILDVTQQYNPDQRSFSLTFRQHTPPTPGQPEETKKPLMIPIVTGLLSSATGKELAKSRVLMLTEEEQTFVFENIR